MDSLLGIVVVHADLSLAPLESLEPADIGKSWENIAPSTFLWFYLDHKFRRGHVSCWLRKTRDDVLKKKLEVFNVKRKTNYVKHFKESKKCVENSL